MRKKTTRSAASNLTKIGTWHGVPTHVDANGTFYAEVDDIEIQADRLEAVRAKIDAALKPTAKKAPMSLPVLVLYDEKVIPTTIVGISRANRAFQFDPPTRYAGRHSAKILADTPANRERAEVYIRTEKEAAKALNAVKIRNIEITGYGRIEIEQYEGVAAHVVAEYKKSAE